MTTPKNPKLLVSRDTKSIIPFLNPEYKRKYQCCIIDVLEGNFKTNVFIQKLRFQGKEIEEASKLSRLRIWFTLNIFPIIKGLEEEDIASELPDFIFQNLIDYLQNEREIQERIHSEFEDEEEYFDCWNFVEYVNGESCNTKRFKAKNLTLAEPEAMTDKDYDEIVRQFFLPGDTVHLATIEGDLRERGRAGQKIKKGTHHYGLYLGGGLFISKYGKAPLAISTLAEMMKIYPNNIVSRIRPKKGQTQRKIHRKQ